MAALRGVVIGRDGQASCSRLSNRQLTTKAATWNTFVDTDLNKDGSGCITAKRGGKSKTFCLNSEDKELEVTQR